ncbi:hypothetical protein GIB67_017115 [Kingdonia uniflora]|uniref:LOB domain-containing protein n=1 Tax=Kingdonia uniflora TaxID=39325 RepID=A0A7J7ND59_9MAGN|nr:hypothetical protein GIB67_017115 [Kingdonia uniflora]
MEGQQEHSRSASSCGACKFLKRKCVPKCIFAPHFHSDELPKFAKVHKVFGASNVSKILSKVPEELRADTVSSLVYEAEARVRDPINGCMGDMVLLETERVHLEHELAIARAHLSSCIAPSTPPFLALPDSAGLMTEITSNPIPFELQQQWSSNISDGTPFSF